LEEMWARWEALSVAEGGFKSWQAPHGSGLNPQKFVGMVCVNIVVCLKWLESSAPTAARPDFSGMQQTQGQLWMKELEKLFDRLGSVLVINKA
jgi:hypothetical protein